MSRFRPAREIQRVIGAAASAVIADEYDETLPCPVRAGGGVVLREVFFLVSGLPARRKVNLPAYVVDVDGEQARIVRLARCTPEEVGLTLPLSPVPGASTDPTLSLDDHLRRRDRLLDLAPAVWEAFVAGVGAPGGASAVEVGEYLELHLAIVWPEVAPFYEGVAPDFFQWLRANAAGA